LQRYFIEDTDWINNEIVIEGNDAHHILRVMRHKTGDKIICNHPDGKAAVCTITDTEKNKVVAEVQKWLDRSAEIPVKVTIVQGLPKGDKMDLILQKGTELGASAFIPLIAERTVVVWDEKKADKKVKRYKKIVKEASEQSHRNLVPTIYNPMNIADLITESTGYDLKIFAYEEEAKVDDYRSFGTIIKQLNEGERLIICIGPEGGFSENEASILKENDFQPVRLGPRILRTETAPLYALASISYHFEES